VREQLCRSRRRARTKDGLEIRVARVELPVARVLRRVGSRDDVCRFASNIVSERGARRGTERKKKRERERERERRRGEKNGGSRVRCTVYSTCRSVNACRRGRSAIAARCQLSRSRRLIPATLREDSGGKSEGGGGGRGREVSRAARNAHYRAPRDTRRRTESGRGGGGGLDAISGAIEASLHRRRGSSAKSSR